MSNIDQGFPEQALDPSGPLDNTSSALELLALFRRRWIAMILGLSAAVAGAVFYCAKAEPVYESTVRILLKVEALRPLGRTVDGLESGNANYWLHQELRRTQLMAIKSQAVLERVVENLGLGNDDDFLGIQGGTEEEREERRKKADPIGKLKGSLDVEALRESMLVDVRCKDRDPQRATRIANAVVTAYTDHRRASKVDMAAYAVGWLEDQLVALGTNLDQTEKQINEFQEANGVRATSFKAQKELVARQQAELTQALLVARQKQWAIDAERKTFDSIRSGQDSIRSSPVIADDPTVQEASRQISALEVSLAELDSRYGQEHPRRMEVKSQLDRANAARQTEIDAIFQRTVKRKAEADQVAARVQGELTRVRADALRLNQLSIEYERMTYKLENYRDLYALVLKRSKETQISGVTQFVDVELQERAEAPRSPVWPNIPIILLVSVMLGLVLGTFAVFFLETVDTGLSGADEAQRIVGATYLGSVLGVNGDEMTAKVESLSPSKRKEFNDLTERQQVELFPVYFNKSSVAESIRLLRTNILFSAPGKEFDTLLVTSPHPKEGKSTIVSYLGHALASMGKRVLLVDSDLHRPMLHKIYGLPNTKGLSNMIVDSAEVEEVAQDSHLEGLDIVTSGPLPPNSAELLASNVMEGLLEKLREKYDFVILDSPPILALSDALVLSRLVHGLLLVVQPAITTRPALKATARHLADVRAPVAGFVLNKIDPQGQRGYYGYSKYGYGYAYGSYYERNYSLPEDPAEARA